MGVLVSDINSKDWSLSLKAPGEIVTDLDDIEQCLLIICTTDRGSDPLRPEFGTNIFRWLDKARGVAAPNIVQEITEGIEIWEKRSVVNKVTYQLNEIGHASFFIDWQTVDGRKPGQPLKLNYSI